MATLLKTQAVFLDRCLSVTVIFLQLPSCVMLLWANGKTFSGLTATFPDLLCAPLPNEFIES